MRGGWLHNTMIRALASACGQGCTCRVEHPVPGGSVDLWIANSTITAVVEVELTADRIGRDLAKARSAKATHLFIVTPARRTADAARRRLSRLGTCLPGMEVCVLTQGQALRALRRLFP